MVDSQELLDWFIRYTVIFRKRNTHRQKSLFLKSLKADVETFRNDVQIDHFKLHKKDPYSYNNLYVGSMKQADTIICTYYDTPAVQWQSYEYFNNKLRERKITRWILTSSMVYILLGFLFTIFIGVPIFVNRTLFSPLPIFLTGCYILYFLLLGQITRGWPTKHTLVSNTSSVLALLDATQQFQDQRIAFAFVDAGCTNEAGLKRILKRKKGRATILIVENIGGESPLHLISENETLLKRVKTNILKVNSDLKTDPRVMYVVSAQRDGKRFVLSRKQLLNKRLNEFNMDQFTQLVSNL